MSDNGNSADIKVGIDGSGVEVGLRKIEDSVAKTGKSIESLSKGDGMSSLGRNAEQAAARFGDGSKTIIDAIQKQTLALDRGTKGTSDYFANWGRQRGLDPAILKPYIDQLDAVRARTLAAADAQKKLDESTKFLEALRTRNAEFGKTAAELAEMRAAQLGVSDAAAPLIEQMKAAEEAAGGLGGAAGIATGALAGLAAAAAGAVSFGAIVAGVSAAITKLADLDDMAQKTGSSVENLSRLQKVASVVGEDFGNVDKAVAKLAAGMGGLDEDSNKVNAGLKRLGISSKDAAGDLRDPALVLIEAAKALQEYGDGAGKTALINNLLGKSGADLLPYLNDVAESVDDMGAATAAAAASAGAFQDSVGLLQSKADSLYVSLASQIIPSLTDLVTAFGDAAKGQNDLFGDTSAASWADNIAAAIARVADFALLLPRVLNVVAGAFKAVAADVGLAATAIDARLNPVSVIRGVIDGNKDLTDGLKERNRVVGEFNAELEDLLAKPVDSIYKNVAARIADRQGFQDAFGDKFMKSVEEYGKKQLGSTPSDDDAKKRADALKKEAETYKQLIDAIDLRIAATAREAAGLAPLAESARLQIALDKLIADGDLKAKDARTAKYRGLLNLLSINEQIVESEKRKADAEALNTKGQTTAAGELQVLRDAAEAQRTQTEEIGLTKLQLADLRAARLENVAATKEETAGYLEMFEPGNAVAAIYRQQAAAIRELGAELVKGAGREDEASALKKASDDLDKYLDPNRAQSFGDALRDAFKGAGSALVGLTTTFQSFSQKQAENDRMRDAAARKLAGGESSIKQYYEEIGQLSKRNTQEQLRGYGDMAGAAAGFFDEQSSGYKALQGISQAFHAAQLAQNLASILPAMAAGAAQMFAQSGWGGFAGAAAMAALIGGFGVAVGGGFNKSAGGMSAADVQKGQGTDSVFGDTSAKSDSIAKSLERIENSTFQGLTYSAGMLDSLRKIEASMSGLSNLVIRTTGLTDGKAFGVQEGAIDGARGPFRSIAGDSLSKRLESFFGSTKQSIVDAGIQFGGSLNDLQDGRGYSQYASVDTTKKSFFGLVKKTTNSVETGALSDELSNQFALIFTSLEDSLKGAAVGMGLGADLVTTALDSLVLDVTKLSLKDLKGDELTAAISAVISKAMDDISAAAFPSFDEFRKVGEGYAETVLRVAQNFAAIDTVFASFGKTFGMLGLESISARERLIELSGGLEKFTSQGEFFLSNFFTEAEQNAALKTRIAPTLDKFGLSAEVPDATKLFRDFIVGLDTTKEAGAEAYAALQTIAPAFLQIANAAQEAAETLASAKSSIDIDIMEASGDSRGATLARRAIELADLSKIDPSLATLKQTFYDIADAAKIAATAQSLDIEMLNVTGRSAEALALTRQGEIDALNEISPLLGEQKRLIFAAADAYVALNKEMKARQEAERNKAQGDIDSAKTALDDAGKVLGNLAALEPPVKSMVDRLLDTRSSIKTLTDGLAQLNGTIEQTSLEKLSSLIGNLNNTKDFRVSLQDAIEDARFSGLSGAAQVDALKARESSLFGQLDTAKDPAAVAAQLQATIIDRIKLEGSLRELSMREVFELEKQARDTQRESLTEQIEGLERIKSLSETFGQFTGSLKFGDLSALNAFDQKDAAQSLYNTTLDKARGGDEFALSQITNNAQAYLQELKDFTGTSGNYAAEFARVIADIDSLGAAGANVDPQLTALQSQLTTLDAISKQQEALVQATVDTSAQQVTELTILNNRMGTVQDRQEQAVKDQTALIEKQIAQFETIAVNQQAQINQQAAIVKALGEKLDKANDALKDLVDRQALEAAKA